MKYCIIFILLIICNNCVTFENECRKELTEFQCNNLPEPPNYFIGQELAIELARLKFFSVEKIHPLKIPKINFENRFECFDINSGGCAIGYAQHSETKNGNCEIYSMVNNWEIIVPHELYHCWLYWFYNDSDYYHRNKKLWQTVEMIQNDVVILREKYIKD